VRKNLVIIGAGGLAREVHDLAYYCFTDKEELEVKGFLSDGPSSIECMGYPPVLSTVSDYDISPNDVFICAIGNVQDRKKTIQIIKAKGGEFINLIHPTCVIAPSAKLGEGVVIKAFCVIASDVVIGDFVFLQSSVIMGHDVQIGDYTHINSFSFFAGYVNVGEQCVINAGARFVQNVKVGSRSVVGMGSVVLRNVPEGVTVFGAPAKKISY
jgi:sugar O-acyltransferase (sialic acid O-acetyltransferase NeuD family)